MSQGRCNRQFLIRLGYLETENLSKIDKKNEIFEKFNFKMTLSIYYSLKATYQVLEISIKNYLNNLI